MRAVSSSLLLLLLIACVRSDETPAAVAAPEPVSESTSLPRSAEPAVIYDIAESSGISFVGTKVTGRNAGGFHTFEGEIAVVGGDPARSSVRAAIDTTSLWADHPDLAAHLKSDDFLTVSSFPWASFTSTRVEPLGDGGYRLTGNLDLHGVVREVSFPARIAVTGEEVEATATVSLDRFDFGVDFPGLADDLIAPQVKVELQIRAVRRPDPEAAEPAAEK